MITSDVPALPEAEKMNVPNPSRQSQINRLMRKISRISAYALFAGAALLVLSGWGITQTGIIYKLSFGLIDRRLANAIHRAANAPVAFMFLVHVLLNIRINITSKHPAKARLIDAALWIVGGILLGIVVYMEYFRLGG
jgi:cytochrome b subunit of formate dehydrogenase